MADEKNTQNKEEEKKIDEQPKKENEKEVKTEEPAPAKEEKKEEPAKEEKKVSDLKAGMTVKVFQKIKELNAKGEEKERVQFFEGIVIAKKHGGEAGGTITVRKVSNGVGVEKIFPLNLPTITKIEIKKESKVRRAKLYFLKRGYRKKLKEIKR